MSVSEKEIKEEFRVLNELEGKTDQWVSVDDRLPVNPRELVQVWKPEWTRAYALFYDGGWVCDEGTPRRGITHWKPLDNPPEAQPAQEK